VTGELVSHTTRAAHELVTRTRAGPVHVDIETKKMMFQFAARILFNVDARALSGDFVHAVNFIEECFANRMFPSPSAAPGTLELRYRAALALQDQTGAWIVRESGIGSARGLSGTRVKNTAIRTILNGYNATATALTWIIFKVSQEPLIQQRLRQEIDELYESCNQPTVQGFAALHYTRWVVKESLRLYPPAWNFAREALASDRIGGVYIPQGAVISISPYTMHRHRLLWVRPGEFLPERFAPGRYPERHPFAFFPFGGGTRKCPAAHLVIGHLQVILAIILRLCQVEPASAELVRPRGLISLVPHPGVWARFIGRDHGDPGFPRS
jgi:hypothetical protein